MKTGLRPATGISRRKSHEQLCHLYQPGIWQRRHLIGKQLAARLGIPCYDRTLILKTAEKSGLSPDFIARAEERARSRFHMSIAPIGIGAPTMSSHGIPVSHQAFFAQSDVIRELADQGPCVIVGRCSD